MSLRHPLVVGSALLMCLSVSHATPNGKPFVELQGEIHEVQGAVQSLQDRIDALVARVDTVEQQSGAYGAAIADLQAQSADLQAQIDGGADDIAALEAQVADNQALIVAMQDRIAVVEQVLADAQQNEAGLCPDGNELDVYNPATGQTVCRPTNWPQEAGVFTRRTVRLAPGRTFVFDLGCPLEAGVGRRAGDLTVDQTGALQLVGVARSTYSNFRVTLANPTQTWQVANLGMYCASPY